MPDYCIGERTIMNDSGSSESVVMGVVEKKIDVCLDDSEVIGMLQSAVCLPLSMGGVAE